MLLDLIFPPRCAACKEHSPSLICPSCTNELPVIDENICRFCGRPTINRVHQCRECRGRRLYFNWARSAWRYSGVGKEIIHAFKYENERRLATVLAATVLAKLPPEATIDMVTWVPLHPAKQADRGYNQSELLGREIGRMTGIESLKILKRSRWTADQNKLELDKRKENVKDAFSLSTETLIRGKNVLLVDDVYTTGATVSECSRVLKRGGAAKVGALTLARTVLDR